MVTPSSVVTAAVGLLNDQAEERLSRAERQELGA
jgi:hypothetical protein